MTIGERLLKLRKEKNISQEELANVLDVSRQTISKWETDQTTPDFDKIIPLCEYFGITSDELLSGKKDIIESKKEDNKKIFARNIAISVGLYILSLVFVIVSAEVFNNEILGVSLFFITIAIATTLIVYTAINYGSKKEKKRETKKDKTVKQVCEIIDILGVVIYFIVSFLTMAWHITWIIFLIIGLCEAIVKLIFGLSEDNKEEIKEGEKENE
ncbi:MAG: helix-turn-helix domain-containing protein [Bacilli bacterium]|nr:helix-turn-helix domain-containing protein [Bacilli bacterium]